MPQMCEQCILSYACFMTLPSLSGLYFRATPNPQEMQMQQWQCRSSKSKLNFMVTDGTNYCCSLWYLKEQGCFWGLKYGWCWQGCSWGKASEEGREIKSEPGQQEPSTLSNPANLPKIVLGDGGLLTLGFSPAVLTSIRCSATNQLFLTLQQAWAGCI